MPERKHDTWWVYVYVDRDRLSKWAEEGPLASVRLARERAAEFRRAGYYTAVYRDLRPEEGP